MPRRSGHVAIFVRRRPYLPPSALSAASMRIQSSYVVGRSPFLRHMCSAGSSMTWGSTARSSISTATVSAASDLLVPITPVGPLLIQPTTCLLYTSDAADEEDSVDLGGR